MRALRYSLLLFLVFGLFFVCISAAFPVPRYRHGTRTYFVDFSGDLYVGDLKSPDGEYIEARKGIKLQSLIRKRNHWKQKVTAAVQALGLGPLSIRND